MSETGADGLRLIEGEPKGLFFRAPSHPWRLIGWYFTLPAFVIRDMASLREDPLALVICSDETKLISERMGLEAGPLLEVRAFGLEQETA